MKAKLLKIVRKRYSISKITDLGTNASDVYQAIANELGLPFYAVDDDRNGFGIRSFYYKSFDDAYCYLQKMIRKDYAHKVKHRKLKYETVWYKN